MVKKGKKNIGDEEKILEPTPSINKKKTRRKKKVDLEENHSEDEIIDLTAVKKEPFPITGIDPGFTMGITKFDPANMTIIELDRFEFPKEHRKKPDFFGDHIKKYMSEHKSMFDSYYQLVEKQMYFRNMSAMQDAFYNNLSNGKIINPKSIHAFYKGMFNDVYRTNTREQNKKDSVIVAKRILPGHEFNKIPRGRQHDVCESILICIYYYRDVLRMT